MLSSGTFFFFDLFDFIARYGYFCGCIIYDLILGVLWLFLEYSDLCCFVRLCSLLVGS